MTKAVSKFKNKLLQKNSENAQAFAEKMITLIEAKTQEIINKVEKQERESLDRKRLKSQTSEIEDQVKMTEAIVKKN